jgi:hypothetical protein
MVALTLLNVDHTTAPAQHLRVNPCKRIGGRRLALVASGQPPDQMSGF